MPDSYATLLHRYLQKHKALVKPNQGWGSLHSSLHLAFSMGRKRGFTDLGTYVDKAGDHGWDDKRDMAMAFDLGRKDRFRFKGYDYLVARRFCNLLAKHHEALGIRYIILGDRIWHRNSGQWVYFSNYPNDRSHDFHIHVSGQAKYDV
jgi:hypothetical protein